MEAYCITEVQTILLESHSVHLHTEHSPCVLAPGFRWSSQRLCCQGDGDNNPLTWALMTSVSPLPSYRAENWDFRNGSAPSKGFRYTILGWIPGTQGILMIDLMIEGENRFHKIILWLQHARCSTHSFTPNHVHTYTYMHTYTYTIIKNCVRRQVGCACGKHVDVRGQLWVLFLCYCPSWFLRPSLSMAWCSPVKLGWLASKPQRSSCLCLTQRIDS